MSSYSGKPWSVLFGRCTDDGQAAWADRQHLGAIAGVSQGHHSAVYMGSIRWIGYADGGWEYHSGYGFGARHGARIYGWGTLRFLCALHGIKPPSRRLTGEPFVPDTTLLVAAVWDGLRQQPEDGGPQPSGVHDHKGRTPTPLNALNPQASEFWLRLKEAHLRAGIKIEWPEADNEGAASSGPIAK